ncbi:MAG: cytochrome b5 domain-containing protein [Patescibacteria group bacterium]|nr:cytochrome b5 domain-containing protein [Patescibacteria group bacterium]
MKNISKELFFGVLIILIIAGIIFYQSKNDQKITQKSASNKQESTISPAISSEESKKISVEEVKKHSKKEDCYMIIENKVYDLTSYIDSHPGGLIIARFCGKDGTGAFNARGKEKEPHSPKARELLKKYYLADLEK